MGSEMCIRDSGEAHPGEDPGRGHLVQGTRARRQLDQGARGFHQGSARGRDEVPVEPRGELGSKDASGSARAGRGFGEAGDDEEAANGGEQVKGEEV